MEGIIPYTDLQSHYVEIAKACRENREPVFITKDGREDTVLLGSAEYRSMKAELELCAMLAQAQAETREGRVAPMEDTFREASNMLSAWKSL